MLFSRFRREDLSETKEAIDPPPPIPDMRYSLSLNQTREELKQALRYKQAYEFMIQEIEGIVSSKALPLVKVTRLERCLATLGTNYPDLGG